MASVLDPTLPRPTMPTLTSCISFHDISGISNCLWGSSRGYGGIGASQEVQIKEVFPRLAAKRAGFDLYQVEIAQGERAEGAEEGAGDQSEEHTSELQSPC